MIDVHLDGLLNGGVHVHVTFHGFHCDVPVKFRMDADIEKTRYSFSAVNRFGGADSWTGGAQRAEYSRKKETAHVLCPSLKGVTKICGAALFPAGG